MTLPPTPAPTTPEPTTPEPTTTPAPAETTAASDEQTPGGENSEGSDSAEAPGNSDPDTVLLPTVEITTDRSDVMACTESNIDDLCTDFCGTQKNVNRCLCEGGLSTITCNDQDKIKKVNSAFAASPSSFLLATAASIALAI